jgi:diamine N-acetyltransferase
MTTIAKASVKDFKLIAEMGRITVEEAHRSSCSAADMNDFLEKNYNETTIQEELKDPKNIYHIIYYNGQAAGFSKIILNAEHPNIQYQQATKLDRIYLLKEFFNLKLGFELLQFNINFSKENQQSGMWLFTWTGNERAVNFYLKTGFKIVGSHSFKISETHSNPNHQMFLKYPSSPKLDV